MTNNNFEQLVRDYPSIFQKSGNFEFSIGDGWYTIINALLGLICNDLEQAQRKLAYAMNNPDSKYSRPIAELEAEVADEHEKLPTIVQVKEKFGGLRFYIDGGTSETHAYIEFAELMSTRTCEVCGAPGEARNDGWVKVLCDAHHKAREEKSNPGSYPSRKTFPEAFEE